jgi:hypothetical protein
MKANPTVLAGVLFALGLLAADPSLAQKIVNVMPVQAQTAMPPPGPPKCFMSIGNAPPVPRDCNAPQVQPDPNAAYRSLGEQALKASLIDPYSAVIQWSPEPFEALTMFRAGLFGKRLTGTPSDPLMFGCGVVNAKNRMGGYVGRAVFDVVIKDGQVVSVTTDEAGDPVTPAAQICAKDGFTFPPV